MGSTDLTAVVETPEEVFDPVVEISNTVVEISNKMVACTKIVLAFLVCAVSNSYGSPTRLRRAPQETSNRLFTGNSAIDAGAAGAVLGAAAQFFGNQILNPCRGGNRGNTNTRLVNGETLQ